MRLLHPTTIQIVSRRKDIPKTVISHCWSEIFKFISSKQTHPKVFFTDMHELGDYARFVYEKGILKGCNLDPCKVYNRKSILFNFYRGFMDEKQEFHKHFDSDYLFSDACSLYFKGINIFPDIFGDKWRKYVPVESLKEIYRQVIKTLNK
jgi:hypothetical protein